MIKSLDELVPQPKGRAASRPVAQRPTLASCVVQVKDFFTPGHQGAKARIRSAHQLRKHLGIQRAVEGQAESQDCISKTVRVARAANRMATKGIQTSRQYWRDEARTATGLYRGWVGFGQGVTTVGDIGLRGTRTLAKLGVGVTGLGYRALQGEVDLAELARKGNQAALIAGDKVGRYVVSGHLVTDAKKFSKDLSEYGLRVVHDPVLELPKAAVIVGATALTIGPQRIAAGARGLSGLLGRVAGRAGTGESALAAAQSESALAAETTAATETGPGLASTATAAEETAGTVGGITPKGYVPRTAAPTVPLAPPPPPVSPVNQELMRNLRQALRLSEKAAPKTTLPTAPVELPPHTLPPTLKTPVCLPSSNYAPVAPKGYLQILDRLEGGLDITG